jgi:cytochrome P450
MEVAMSTVAGRHDFDPHDPEYALNPWATFKRMRAECPVSHSDRYDGGFWILSKYADVKAVSLDPERFSSDGDLMVPSTNMGWKLLPIQCDPPLTAECRRTINHVFHVRAVRELEPTVRRWTREAIEGFIAKGACDVVPDLAYPVPAKVTTHLMGWPVDEWEAVLHAIKDFTTRAPDEPERAEARGGVERLRTRVIENIELRRREPASDLASHLLGEEMDGRPLTEDEIVGLMMMVVFGGVDTTVASIGNMLHYLDLDRELRARLIADPGLIPAAVEELLRYEPPIQGFARIPNQPTVLGGHEIPASEKVLMLFGSANHDEDVFESPDEVWIDRPSNPHLTFGVGVHRCQGATLARMELRVVLEEVLSRIPDYRIDHDQVVHTHTAGTIFERLSLPATFAPRTPLDSAA